MEGREADLYLVSDHPVSAKADKPTTRLEVSSLCFSCSTRRIGYSIVHSVAGKGVC